MIVWPEKLLHDIARRRCVAFLGAGVSRRSVDPDGRRPPLWKEFLLEALDRCDGSKAEIKRLINGGDYLGACQLIKQRLGDHSWHDLLEAKFHNPPYRSNELHQYIFDLDLPIVATTNIDMIYDRFLNGNYQGATTIKAYHDDALGRYVKGDAATRLVVKVHGSVDNLPLTIFTRQEYANARSSYPQFYGLISSLLATHTFLFLGYSLSDPDINLLLEDQSRKFRSPRPHYLVTADNASEDMARMFEQNFSIKVLKYSSARDHQGLVDSLNDLSKRVGQERADMAAKAVW